MLSEKLELKFKMMKMHDVWLLKKALAVINPNKRGVLQVDSPLQKHNSHFCKHSSKLVKKLKK